MWFDFTHQRFLKVKKVTIAEDDEALLFRENAKMNMLIQGVCSWFYIRFCEIQYSCDLVILIETALLKVTNDLLQAADGGNCFI